ncbi:hypothetical protein JCM17380_44230 [Desulfosporosinus burensis]
MELFNNVLERLGSLIRQGIARIEVSYQRVDIHIRPEALSLFDMNEQTVSDVIGEIANLFEAILRDEDEYYANQMTHAGYAREETREKLSLVRSKLANDKYMLRSYRFINNCSGKILQRVVTDTFQKSINDLGGEMLKFAQIKLIVHDNMDSTLKQHVDFDMDGMRLDRFIDQLVRLRDELNKIE